MIPAQMRRMRQELEKHANLNDQVFVVLPSGEGAVEKALPWYGVTGGSVLGGAMGSKAVPKKYKLLGTLGGALAGTAVGLHGGTALGRKIDDYIEKNNEAEQVEKMPPHPAITLGKYVGGLGAGMAAGYAGMQGTDYLLRRAGKPGLSAAVGKYQWALPALMSVGGLAYTHAQQRAQEKMRQDYNKRQELKRVSKST